MTLTAAQRQTLTWPALAAGAALLPWLLQLAVVSVSSRLYQG